MLNTRVLGVCFIVIGLLLVSDGARGIEVEWLHLAGGAMFLVVGVLRLAKARASKRPTS